MLFTAPVARAEPSDLEAQSFLIPRAELLERVHKVGVFRLEVPKAMRLPTSAQDDLERWILSELATTGLEVERASEVQRVWDQIERRVRFPKQQEPALRERRETWSEAMHAALDLHGRRELRRRLGLDALLVPRVRVIAARPGTEIGGRRPAVMCLEASLIDMDGSLLYRDGACLLVFEWPDGDGIKLRESRRELESALRRRYLAAASLHALRGVPAPARPD
jgi:hypothetical protein